MNAIDEFINALHSPEKDIAAYLRSIILDSSPKFTERLSYRVPYFYIHSRICFIWPASAPYSIIKEGVQLGFCKGNLLSNRHGVLDMADRKEIGIVVYTDTNQIDEDIVREMLFEAIDADALWAQNRKTKR